MRAFAARFGAAAWLGWQMESNWADALSFSVYTLLRPLGTAFILAGIYWAVARSATHAAAFTAFFVANAFHEYVVRVVVGMGWIVVEDREEDEMLKYVYASPIGMVTYLWGRAVMRFVLASVSVILMLSAGWLVLGLSWDWNGVRWAVLIPAFLMGLTATAFLGLLVAGWALVLPRIAMSVNEGVGVALYLLCGVIFPIDLLPRGLQLVALSLPFTYWYEALRRFLLGRGASALLSHWSDGLLLSVLTISTLAFAALSFWGYRALERRARREGRLDQGTLF